VPIRVLPQEVASAIAAGEVIERPASVVRELVENAIDAGARRIEVRFEGAGQTLIEVSDDGVGIPPAELSLAVARYATSKLDSAEGLFAVRTLGFRGEALASIAAVSRLEIVSRETSEASASGLRVEGGEAAPLFHLGAPVGTVVRVRDLFFNTPARRKFLKSETTERRRLMELVARYAVAYPGIRFLVLAEGRATLETSGQGDARAALASVFDLATARSLIAIEPAPETPVSVSGFVSPPTVHRATRRDLTFFVNGRWVLDAALGAGVLQAYHGLLMVGRFPLGFLRLDLDPSDVDVNVHPSKAEVRFRRPDIVVATLQRVVRATMLAQAPATEVEFPRLWGAAAPASTRPEWADPIDRGGLASASGGTASMPRPSGAVPLLRAVGQVGAAYLVAEGPDGLYLIDQHAAHERILFEKMTDARATATLEVQALLDLEPVELSRSQLQMLEALAPALARIGVGVEPFGGSAVRVRTLPALLSDLDPAEAVRTALGEFEEDETPLQEEVEARLAARVCKRAAIRAGQILSLAEQERLLRDLEACRSPRTCPHGRPTMIHISVDALEKQFGRRG
jgi:DNA mismatch repair protein MutL